MKYLLNGRPLDDTVCIHHWVCYAQKELGLNGHGCGLTLKECKFFEPYIDRKEPTMKKPVVKAGKGKGKGGKGKKSCGK